MPPGTSEKRDRLLEETPDGSLAYISKSRIKQWKQCPRKWAFQYLQGHRPEDNYHFKKGRRLHLTFETFYKWGHSWVKHKDTEPSLNDLVPGYLHSAWGQYPGYLINFLKFEERRLAESDSLQEWLPVGVEEELWFNDPPIPNSPPWMGYADLIVNASSLPEVDTDQGVVVVDFKTGKTPDPQYREDGIFLEGTFYGMMFQEKYDLAGVAGYYPKNDDFLFSEPSEKRQEKVVEIINEMLDLTDRYEKPEDVTKAEKDESPLCYYVNEDGPGGCQHYIADSKNPEEAEPESGECDSK